MSNHKNNKKNVKSKMSEKYEVFKTQCLSAFLKLKNWYFVHKTAILQELRFILLFATLFVIILQFLHIYSLNYKLDKTIQVYEQKIVHIEADCETQLSEQQNIVKQLQDEITDLNKLNKNLDDEVSELNKVIKVIANNLNMSKKDLISNPKTVSRGGGDWQTFEQTAYVSTCRGCIGITKLGLDVRNTIYHEGLRIIAVDPNVIKLGSIVEVKRQDGSTYKAIAADTGGAIKGSIVDLLVSDTQTAIRKGRQTVQLRIIQRGE